MAPAATPGKPCSGSTISGSRKDGSSAPPANRQKDYLKSFVGSVYTGDSWERLASQDQGELSNLLDGEHPQLLLDRFSQEFYAPSASQYTLSVENTATNPRCVYVPYGLMGDSVDGASLEFVSDGFLQSARFFSGTSAYQLRAWGIPNSALFYPTQAQQGLLDGYARSQGVELDSSLDWLQIPGIDQLLEELNASLMEAPEGPAFASFDLWTIPEDLRSYLTPQQQELSRGWRPTTALSTTTTPSCLRICGPPWSSILRTTIWSLPPPAPPP